MSQENLTSTPARSLDERLDSSAEAWRPKPGDKLIGQIVDVDERTTEFGTYPVVTILTDTDDEVAVHGFHTVLKNEFAKRRPHLGERIGLKYTGKSDRGYEGYRIVWEDVVPPDWDRIGLEAAAEEAVSGGEPERPEHVDSDTDIPF